MWKKKPIDGQLGAARDVGSCACERDVIDLACCCFRTFVSHRRTEVPNRPSFPLVKGGLLNKQQGHSLGLQVGVYKPEPLFEKFYVI